MLCFQNAILALDSSTLDIDQVENLIKFCPTKEEMELLKVQTSPLSLRLSHARMYRTLTWTFFMNLHLYFLWKLCALLLLLFLLMTVNIVYFLAEVTVAVNKY